MLVIAFGCEYKSMSVWTDDVPVDAHILELCVSHQNQDYSSADFGVTELVLVDAETGEALQALNNGGVIDLAQYDGRLSIRANTGGETESVLFSLDGDDDYHTDSSSPFFINGDEKKKHDNLPEAWSPDLGFHTLKATGFSKKNGNGDKGKSVTVAFLVINENVSAHIGEAKVTAKHSGMVLTVDEPHKKKTKLIQDVDRDLPYQYWKFVRLSSGAYEIISEATGLCLSAKGKGKSKDTLLETCKRKKEQQWLLDHDSDEWYRIINRKKDYCLTVKKDSDEDGAEVELGKCKEKGKKKHKGKGKDKDKDNCADKGRGKGTSHCEDKEAANLWKIEGDASSIDNSMAVLSFLLVNANTFETIRVLEDGDEIDPTKFDFPISIRAETIGEIGSVLFSVDDVMAYQLENYIPYMIEGNTASLAIPWEPDEGERIITAIPYAMKDAMGLQGRDLTVTLYIVVDDDPGGDDDTETDDDTEGDDTSDTDDDTEGDDTTDTDDDTEGDDTTDTDVDTEGGQG